MLVVKLDNDEHAALCGLVQEKIRQYTDIESIEESKLLENSDMFCNVIISASRKAKRFKIAYQVLLDSLMRYESEV